MSKPSINKQDIINAVVESARQKFQIGHEKREARKKVLTEQITALALKSYKSKKPSVNVGWNSEHAVVHIVVSNKQISKLTKELHEISGIYFDEKRVRRNAMMAISPKAKAVIDTEVAKSIEALFTK